MHPKTQELLLQLERLDWFSHTGLPLPADPDVVAAKTWEEALDICVTLDSENAQLEARNALTMQLSMRHREAYDGSWNPLAIELKPKVEKLVQMKMAVPATRSRVPGNAPKVFFDALHWDWVTLCMVHEYSDLVPLSKYYQLLERYYLAGRFPCGWIGEVPDNMAGAFELGKLAVL